MREAAVMLIVRDGLILAISRRKDKTKFGFPGGKCEPNELPMSAAARETLEETGVSVNGMIHIYSRVEPRDAPDGEDFKCHCYFALDWQGDPHNSEEGEVKWLSEYDLTNPPTSAFPDYNRKTLEVFKNRFSEVPLLQVGVANAEEAK